MNTGIKKLTLIFAFFAFSNYSTAQESIYDITNFGAKPNIVALSTKPIQLAIDAANKNGGGMVVIPTGVFISGTVILKNNVELYLARGAQLLASTNHEDYPRSARVQITKR
jgi:polygalacturonase